MKNVSFKVALFGVSLAAVAALWVGNPLRSEGRVGESSAAAARKAPELVGRPADWINTSGKPIHLYERNGKPAADRITLLTFWTTNCINCKRTLPYWNGWAKRYAASGDVAVISVHTPETQWERDPNAVRRTAQRTGLSFPILIDNDSKNWDAYGVHAWPTTILIDRQGHIRNRWEGELNYDNSGLYHSVEAQIEMLRHEKS